MKGRSNYDSTRTASLAILGGNLCVLKFLFEIPFRMPPNPVLRGSVAASPPTPLRKTAFDSPMLSQLTIEIKRMLTVFVQKLTAER